MPIQTLRPLSLAFAVLFAAGAQGAPAPAGPAAPAPPAPPQATQPPAPAAPVPPPSRDAESRLAEELTRNLSSGKPVELAVGERKVLGLHAEQTGITPKGAVLLIHDLGGHADWPGVIAQLRRQLPAQGWTTLSVQLPLGGAGAPAAQQQAYLDGSAARIDAALAHLRGAGADKVTAIGHGYGAVAALEYAAAKPGAFRALIAVGLPHIRGGDPRLDMEALLARTEIPVLDLYGGGDRLEVVATAQQRRQAARRNPGYSQMALAGADHFFAGQETFLVRRVRGWLERHAAASPAAAPAADNQPQTKATP